MKENYLSPELNLICFVPNERIATIPGFDFDDMENGVFDDNNGDEASGIIDSGSL